MLQELKKKSIKAHILPVVIALALAAVLLWATGFGAFQAIGGPKDLDSLDVAGLEGQYVEAEIYFIYDWYAYTETTNSSTNRTTVTEKEYIIPVGEEEYMGLAVGKDFIRTADGLMDESYELLIGESEEFGESFFVKGTIQRMDEETLDFYHQVVSYDEWTPEEQEMFLPLVLKMNYLGKMNEGATWLLTIAAGVSLLVGCWMLFMLLSGSYQKNIKAYCRASESPEAVMEQLDDFYRGAEPLYGVRIGKWMLFESGGKDVLLDSANAVWAYLRTVQHRTNGIPTGKTFGVVVRTRDKKKYEVAMKNEAAAREVLEAIAKEMPRTVLGYTAALERMYNKRLDDFLRLPDDESLRAEVFSGN